MKIIHVAEAFAGGIPVFIKSLVDHMTGDSHIIVHGDRPYVMSADNIKKQFTENNVRFIRWKSAQRSIHPFKDTLAFLQLYNVLKRLKKNRMVDVVHLHSSKGGFLGRMVCHVLNIRNVIYTPNGAPFMVGRSRTANYLYKKLEKLGSRLRGQVVCCSLSEQAAYERAGIQTVRINNGIAAGEPLPAFPALIPPPDAKMKFRVVCSGRIVHQKNPALFNRIAQYFEDLKQFEFIWIGDGVSRAELTATNITITGWLPVNIAKAMISGGDVYLSTANFEGMSFAVLEALAMKKPVLLTDCIGNKDLVNQGLNGGLFSNDHEAIVKLLQYSNNRPMLKTMGDHSSMHCQDSFDVKNTFEQYHQLYTNGQPVPF